VKVERREGIKWKDGLLCSVKSVTWQALGPMAEWLRRGLQILTEWPFSADLFTFQQQNRPQAPKGDRGKVKR
jgi:hypothetical protein